jgi:4-hydroxy-2-oxoheptanedioate aldolase
MRCPNLAGSRERPKDGQGNRRWQAEGGIVRPNTVKERLRNGEVVVGSFVQYPSPQTVEILAAAGFDYVLIDCEHGPTSPESAYPMVLAAEANNTVSMIRVWQNSPQVLLRYLDLGTDGVMIPQINSREDAEAVVHAVKYHPAGQRGIAGVRASRWAINQPLTDFSGVANRETMIMAQIENINGVEKVPEILEVDGIDVLFVGPNDLAQSMGYPGQTGHPDVQAAIDRVLDMAKGSNVALGTIATSAESTNRMIERGFRIIGTNSANLLADASRQLLSGVKR